MKIEKIIEPNEQILDLQKAAIEEVKGIVSSEHVEAVGGMAVPMIGRPELDILVISEDIERDADKLEANGFMYRTLDGGSIFLKKKVNGVEIAVQLSSPGNPTIERHHKMIDLMRNDDDLRVRYEAFKQTLDGLSRQEYKQKKTEWIKENISNKL
jgi:GrpB-like predicted nucleotidyltransferase (UPF0157 family)